MTEKRNPHAIYFDEPSLTQQCFKDECDINLIIARASSGADIAHVNARVAMYGDFSNVPDYQSALDLVRRAEGMFMSLDAGIRDRFANDPGKMIAFLQDPSNLDEAAKLGLVVKRKLPEGVGEAGAPAPQPPPPGGTQPQVKSNGTPT